jgi:hypothetical protein
MPIVNVIIKQPNEQYYLGFDLDRDPKNGEELPLKSSGSGDQGLDGVYRLSEVVKPPNHSLIGAFQWETQLEKVRDLRHDEKPIVVRWLE